MCNPSGSLIKTVYHTSAVFSIEGPEPVQQDARRNSRSTNVCYQVRRRNALHAAKRIHQVQQRDQQQPLPQRESTTAPLALPTDCSRLVAR